MPTLVTGKWVSSHLPAPRLWSGAAFTPMFLTVLATLSWVKGDNFRAAMLALVAAAVAAVGYRWANARGRVALIVPPILSGAVFVIAYLLSGRVESVAVGVVAGVASMLLLVPRSRAGNIARDLDVMFNEAIASRYDATVRLDEGGARITTGANHRYCTFAELGEPVLRRSGDQVLLLIRDPFLEPIAELIVANYEEASAFCERLRECKDLTGDEHPIPEGLARQDRDLITWQQDLDELATRDYRSAPIATETLFDIAASLRAPLDVRAAATYLLACRDDSRESLTSSLNADTPPLVLALLSLSPIADRINPKWNNTARTYLAFPKTHKRIAPQQPEPDLSEDSTNSSKRQKHQ